MHNSRIRLIFIILLLTTLAITVPYVTLRASGYRFDTQAWRFLPTGAIAVTAVPIGTSVTIEDGTTTLTKQTTAFNTTAFFPDLFPGTYRISTSVSGRQHWTKTTEVVSRETAAFSFVRLFPDEPELHMTLLAAPTKIAPHPDGTYALGWNKEEGLMRFSLQTNEMLPGVEQVVRGDVEQMHWIGKARLLITFNGGAGVLIEGFAPDAQDEQLRVLPLPANTKRAAPLLDEGMVFLTMQGALIHVAFPGKNPIPTPLSGETLAEHVILFAMHGESVTYLDGNGTLWTRVLSSGAVRQRSIAGLNDTITPLRLVAARDGSAISVVDTDGGVWLLARDSDRFSLIAEGIVSAEFSFDTKKLLLAGRREISLYALEDRLEQPIRQKGERVVITRFSEPVLQAALLTPEEEHAIILTDSHLTVVELDPRGGQNDWRRNATTAFAMRSGPARLIYTNAEGQLFILPIPVPGLLSQLLL